MKLDLAARAIDRPVTVLMIVLACLFGGIWGLNTVGRLEDPTFTVKTALIFTPYPGANAEDVETEVSEVIESALQQMQQLDYITSKSTPGLSQVTVEIKTTYDGSELPQIWDEMRLRLRDLRDQLPTGARQSNVNDDFGDVYGLFYAVETEGSGPAEQREIARTLRRGLLPVEGVAKVEIQGLIPEEITVAISSARLTNLGLPPTQLLGVIDDENDVFADGEVSEGTQRLRVSVPRGYIDTGGIEALRLGVPGDVGQISIFDIARVTRAEATQPEQIIRHNGKRVFTLGISALGSANVVEVGARVEERLARLIDEAPDGVAARPIYEQHKVVDDAVTDFLVSLVQSVAIVIGALMLAMGWRAGVLVGTTLVLTILATFFFMAVLDIQMQRISLGALIIAMGMLVDNAIVITEGMVVGMARGKPARTAAAETERDTSIPLLGATVIGIMAFAGIGLSPDQSGEFLFSLFAVIAISLLLSWVLAVTVLPYMGAKLLRSTAEPVGDPHDGVIYRGYARILKLGLRARWLVLLAAVAVTVGAVLAFGQVKQAFFPRSNTPLFYVEYQLPEGADIRATEADMVRLEDAVRGLDGVTDVTTLVGRGASRFMLIYTPEQQSPSYGQLIVRVDSAEAIPALAEEIRRTLPQRFPRGLLRVELLTFGPPTGADVAARFSGPDPQVLRGLAEEALAIYRASDAVTNIRTDWRQRVITITPVIDEARMRLAGVSREAIANTVQFGTSGLQVATLQEQDTQIPLLLRLAGNEREGVERLRDLDVWSQAAEQYVPMSGIVERFEPRLAEARIQRRDRQRTITAEGFARGDLTANQAFTSVRAEVEAIEMPQGYAMEWGGEYESSSDAQASLGRQLPLSFLVMLVISILLFNRLRQPAIVWLVVPMAVTGMVLGLLTTGLAFTFTALLGLLSLSGMLIKNAIVLVGESDRLRAEGVDDYDAVVTGAVSRLRPVILAAGTTILGMTPLLPDAFFASMSVTIMGGLAVASVLTLIVVPVLYALFFGIRPPDRTT
ncbi:efflux RND transporter permease subunit [Roseovarius sp. D22-M7]|uniref:efflux RND transporter permease subunit n=1 Tax=Roseovarius sp. D22-M7 TaxID=3127116 RepID=UPI00300FFFCF